MTSTKKSKPRYINVQRHTASCGPIALANLIKWTGKRTSYSAVLRYCLAIETYEHGVGMWPPEFRLTLKKLEIPVKVRRKFSLSELDAILESGGSVILTYARGNGGHAVFIDSKTECSYRVWNRVNGKGPWYDRKVIQKAIKHTIRTAGMIYVYTFQALR